MRTPENLQELSYTLESPKTFEDLIGSKREYPTAEVVENFLWSHLGGIFETQGLAPNTQTFTHYTKLFLIRPSCKPGPPPSLRSQSPAYAYDYLKPT